MIPFYDNKARLRKLKSASMSNQSLADLQQRDWIRACLKLGLVVETSHGKGSHILMKHPRDGHKYTIQKHLRRLINQKIFKKLIDYNICFIWIFILPKKDFACLAPLSC